MSHVPELKFAADCVLAVLAVMVVGFTALYVTRSPWWRNRIGKIYLAKSLVLSLVLIQITISTWVSLEYPLRQPFRLTIYTLGVVAYVPMAWSLWREQQEDRRRHREEVDRE